MMGVMMTADEAGSGSVQCRRLLEGIPSTTPVWVGKGDGGGVSAR